MAISKPTGEDLCIGTTNGDTLPYDVYLETWEEREITFGSSIELTEGVTYAIVVRAISGTIEGLYWQLSSSEYANGNYCYSSNSGSSWNQYENYDGWFITKASGVEKDSFTAMSGGLSTYIYGSNWRAQTFTASSTYSISSIVLSLQRWFDVSVGTITVSIRAVEFVGPGKAQNPIPADGVENIKIIGINQLKRFQWEAPS